ncbi:MAG: hypothetical protein AAF404_19550, partial [Pseudomonadota bacterium]
QDILQPAATDAHHLRSLLPVLLDDTTTLQGAIRTATKLQKKINTWQSYLNKYLPDASLTAYQIAQRQDLEFTAGQQVELPQRDYDVRIYQHIVGVGLSDDCVAATAQWLTNALTYLEIDIATVRRYLDGEAALSKTDNTRVL